MCLIIGICNHVQEWRRARRELQHAGSLAADSLFAEDADNGQSGNPQQSAPSVALQGDCVLLKLHPTPR